MPRSGSGFGIADDDGAAFDNPTSIPSLGEDFRLLQPRFFRTMLIWNGYEGVPANATPAQVARRDRRAKWVTRTYHMIDQAKAKGAQEIVLTLRENDNLDYGSASPDLYLPSPAKYEAEITKVVQNFASRVDVWGGANEPNLWIGPAGTGNRAVPAATLVQYQAALARVVNQYDPTARITSPDFNDQTPNWLPYVNDYRNLGGGFGDIAAFHPYADAQSGSTSTTSQYAAAVPSGRDIWLTEVGLRPSIVGGLASQNTRIQEMVNANNGLASLDRVTRMAYYHMRWDGNPAWDSGLLDQSLTRRPAWYTWCATAHGDNPAHPDCAPPSVPGPTFHSFNGDNKADLIGADPANARFAVALSSGTQLGAPGTGTWLTGWGGNPHWADIGDFNGDHKTDLIGADPVNARYSVALSDGTQLGAPGSGTWLTSWGGDPEWAGVGDFNGDRRDDLIGADPVNARFVVALSDGSQLGAHGSGSWLTGWGGDPHWADVGDFNGDGKDDLIGADPVSNRFSVALSSGTQLGASGSGTWLTGWGGDPVWAGVGDFNGDGKDDLIGSDPANNRYAVALSNGTQLGASGSGIWLTGWNGNPPWGDVADLNGDGKDDLILADAINARFVVALSTGTSLAGAGSWLMGWGGNPVWAAAG